MHRNMFNFLFILNPESVCQLCEGKGLQNLNRSKSHIGDRAQNKNESQRALDAKLMGFTPKRFVF